MTDAPPAELPAATGWRRSAPWDRADDDSVRIDAVRATVTAPEGVNLVVVTVETSVPGLVGFGCAGFTQRADLVARAVEQYLAPQVIGRMAGDITDITQSAALSSYWRNGPVLNSAVAGLDAALWDIMGKQAGAPVWQLLGGRCRQSVPVYTHVTGRDALEVEDEVRHRIAAGYTHIRCQVALPGELTHGGATTSNASATWDPRGYVRVVSDLFEHLRSTVGDDVELLHDVHERLSPRQAIVLARALEPYRLFFLEDPLAPEDLGWLPQLRAATTVPIAIGELFCQPTEFLPILCERSADFIRAHVSAIGGITRAWRLAAACELFGVRVAWHGPADVSPIGHAANLALDVATTAFGIQEIVPFAEATREVFPGCPEVIDGVVMPTELPGLGVDFDSRAAAAYRPVAPLARDGWTDVRCRDGSVQRP